MRSLSDDASVVQRIFDHIDHKTTDLSEASWREPVEHYRSAERLAAELAGAAPNSDAVLPVGRACRRPATTSRAPPRARRSSPCEETTARSVSSATPAATAARSWRPARAARRHSCAAITAGPTASTARLRHVPHEHGFPGLDKDGAGSCRWRASSVTASCSSRSEKPRSPDAELDRAASADRARAIGWSEAANARCPPTGRSSSRASSRAITSARPTRRRSTRSSSTT